MAATRLIYQAFPAWRGPWMALLNAASSVFLVSFGFVGVAAIVIGFISGSAAPAIFGILWSAVYGYISWTYFHLASRLEYSDGCLSCRCSLPWSPRMRPGRVQVIRWPVSRRSPYARIELNDGRKLSLLPRPGFMEFIDGVRDAEPTVVVDVRDDGRRSKWMRAEQEGYIRQRVRAAGAHRSLQIPLSIFVSLVMLGVVAELSLTVIGPQENFQTLRTDLAKVHLPSGYRLVTTRQARTTCAYQQCSLTQIWIRGGGRTGYADCIDVHHAMASAFSGVDSNSPLAANAACDYYAILGDLLHPGQGKRTIEAIVRTHHAQKTIAPASN